MWTIKICTLPATYTIHKIVTCTPNPISIQKKKWTSQKIGSAATHSIRIMYRQWHRTHRSEQYAKIDWNCCAIQISGSVSVTVNSMATQTIAMEIWLIQMQMDSKSNCMWKLVKWMRHRVNTITVECDGQLISPNTTKELNYTPTNLNRCNHRRTMASRIKAFTRIIIAKIAIKTWFMHRREIEALLAIWVRINDSMKCRCISHPQYTIRHKLDNRILYYLCVNLNCREYSVHLLCVPPLKS